MLVITGAEWIMVSVTVALISLAVSAQMWNLGISVLLSITPHMKLKVQWATLLIVQICL